MNKFVLSALALTTASGFASAGTGSEEWRTLDREIESLASTLAPQAPTGIQLSGFLRAYYANSSDIAIGANDLGGFTIPNARINVDGSVGDFQVHVSLDGGTSGIATSGGAGSLSGSTFGGAGSLGVLDASAAWNINEMFKLTLGQFRSPFLSSSQIDENNLVLISRTFNAALWDFRDAGLMVQGDYDQFNWALAVQNGLDGAGNDLAISANVGFHAMGTGGKANSEGSYGNAQDNNLNISAGFYKDDGTVDDRQAFNIEAGFDSGPLSVVANLVDLDAGLGDATPFSVTGSWMFVPDQWEGALRFEDFDDSNDTTAITAGVNYFMVGHNAKWQLNVTALSSDPDDATVFAIGLVAGV